MKVAKLEIHNFRGIQSGTLHFKDHTLLVGSNNVGKTTVIEALTLLLGRDRLIKELTEHDFYGSDPGETDRIKLIGTITDFGDENPLHNPDWFREGRAVPKWMDEATGLVYPTQDSETWKLCCQIAVQAYFDRDSLAVETIRYFHDHDNPIDPFADSSPIVVPPILVKQFGFFLVRASRTWDKVLSWGSELFRRTLRASDAQPATALLAERDRLRNPVHPIEADSQISTLVGNVNAELRRSMPFAPELKLRVTNTDSRSLMDAISPHFATESGVEIPAGRQGSGLLSLQALLLLLELGRARVSEGESFLMALEEPELHLPPASQLYLVQRVQALSSQTFTTTHSPLIAATVDPTSVILLSQNGGQLCAKPFLEKQLAPNAANWLRKFYQHSRSEALSALMCPAVLVPEGRSEFHLLKIIYRSLMLADNWVSLPAASFGLEIGILPTEDAKVVETFQLLQPIHGKVCCLVDGDSEGTRYAGMLQALSIRPACVISWHPGATLEDVVGWILSADGSAGVAHINTYDYLFLDLAALVQGLKDHKIDIILYEAIASAIANVPLARERALDLFSSLALACGGLENPRFRQDRPGCWIFMP